MKIFKRMGAIFVAAIIAVMALLPITALAAKTIGTDGSVTISNAKKDERYDFYKILDIDYTEGTGGNSDVYRYFIADGWDGFFASELSGTYTSAQWAALTSGQKNNAAYDYIAALAPASGASVGDNSNDALRDFATRVKQYADTNSINANPSVNGPATGSTVSSSNMTYGYYVMVPVDVPTGKLNDTSSVFSVDNVTPEVTIENKSFYPTLEKKVSNSASSGFATSNSAAIGDTVYYELDSNFPDTNGYDAYNYVITDTYSAGITPNINSIAVKIGSTDLVKDTDYTVAHNATAKTITITMNMKSLAAKKDGSDYLFARGDAVVATYSATINENAVSGTAGNLNTANLTFSNDPANGSSTDVTPNDYTKTFVGSFKMTKVDTEGTVLENAVFKLTGANLNHVNITGDALRNSGNRTTNVDASTADGITFTTTASGVVTIEGLEDGTYTLTELTAPEGFQVISDPITITISSGVPAIVDNTTNAAYTGTTATLTDVVDGATLNASTKVLEFNVVNQPKSPLPSTGAMALVGLAGVGAASILSGAILKNKKKNESEDDILD